MKVAVCTIAYNERDILPACINNWCGIVDKHLVLISSQPWNGSISEDDGSARIAREMGAEVIVGYWEDEPTQRNFGLARLWDYDYVLIVDPDELYLKRDQDKVLKRLADPFDYVNRVMRPLPAFRSESMITYWKNFDYVFDPPDNHKPFIAVDPKQARFWGKRELIAFTGEPKNIGYAEPINGVIIHHMSWVKTDKKVKEKLEHYSHTNDIPYWWYDKIWKEWDSNKSIPVRPYGIEKSKAVFKPAPEEIKKLMKQI